MIRASDPGTSIYEDLQPSPDGIVTTFTSSHEFMPQTVVVYLNGLRIPYTDYDVSSGEVVFRAPPLAGDVLMIVYDPS